MALLLGLSLLSPISESARYSELCERIEFSLKNGEPLDWLYDLLLRVHRPLTMIGLAGRNRAHREPILDFLWGRFGDPGLTMPVRLEAATLFSFMTGDGDLVRRWLETELQHYLRDCHGLPDTLVAALVEVGGTGVIHEARIADGFETHTYREGIQMSVSVSIIVVGREVDQDQLRKRIAVYFGWDPDRISTAYMPR